MASCARPCGYGRLIAYIRECDALSQCFVVRWLVAFFGHHGVSFRSAFVWRARAGPCARTHVVGGSVRGARLRLLCPRALVVASCRRCPRVCPLVPPFYFGAAREFFSRASSVALLPHRAFYWRVVALGVFIRRLRGRAEGCGSFSNVALVLLVGLLSLGASLLTFCSSPGLWRFLPTTAYLFAPRVCLSLCFLLRAFADHAKHERRTFRRACQIFPERRFAR